ncbi:ubiquitin-conjugating enzyme E2 34-like [Vicia villosa]|uniref:ubiquitin-conjugating enzyme E2 34-like n=1 Tax=Vicia villosa TaxID=3911 RepID=UPI00273C2AF2|nr:ubiquitin-conjugating enzyme E2 34-like [Vicia villosa]
MGERPVHIRQVGCFNNLICGFLGGFYYGKIKFPPEYPYKPPGISMTTPNGRFMTQKKICLSMSDFHPESWNPMWSASSILTGLLSFMVCYGFFIF